MDQGVNWGDFIKTQQEAEYFKKISAFLDSEEGEVYPDETLRYRAFELTPFEKVKVVILGQDPYHGRGQAMGLSFSVPKGVKLPKSLVNIYKELESDLGISKVTGDLSNWATQGVFLLNTLLSVREKEPLSHRDIGWEVFTDRVIEVLSQREDPIIFVLWGKWAESKVPMINKHHVILKSAHPSPLSAYRGFFGSKVFSKINDQLIVWGKDPIDWSL